jgi:hypothetical protein
MVRIPKIERAFPLSLHHKQTTLPLYPYLTHATLEVTCQQRILYGEKDQNDFIT